MDKSPLIINELFINKMPGFRKGLNAYENLSDGLNLIYGPNASGKSSTARMIKNIIWPVGTNGYIAEARMKAADEQWRISIDATRIVRERNGQPADLQDIPSADTRNRYMLSLHELIQADDKDMADYILRESSGGYDLDAAAAELEFKENIPPKSRTEFKEYERAEEHYQKALESQKLLSREEDRLDQLEAQKQEAELAAKLKRLYEIRQDYLQKRQNLEDAKSRLENYSDAYNKISGNEAAQLENIHEEKAKLKAGIQTDEKTIGKLQEELRKLDVPENGIDDQVLEELKIRQREVSQEETRKKDTQEKLESAKTRAENALQAIDPEADTSRWEGLRLESVTKLQAFLTDAYNRLYQVNTLQQDIQQLDKDLSTKNVADAADIKMALKNLAGWLKSQQAQSSLFKWMKTISLAGMLTAFVTFGLALLSPWAGGIALIIGIAGLTWMGFLRKMRKNQDAQTREHSMQQTPVNGPESWTAEAVLQRIDELSLELAEARRRDQLSYRKQDLEQELIKAESKLQAVRERYGKLKEEIAVLPQWDDQQTDNYAGITWFINNLHQWQEAHTAQSEAEKLLQTITGNIEQNLTLINTQLDKNGVAPVNDAARAEAAIQSLNDRENKRRQKVENQRNARENLKDKQARYDTIRQEEQTIYQKLELKTGELEKVKSMLQQWTEFKEIRDDVKHGERTVNEALNKLQNHPLWLDYKNSITPLTIEEVTWEITRLEQQAGEFQALVEQISDIQSRINAVKEGNELETALTNRDLALENLQNLYEESLTTNTGELLVKRLREETREHNYPPVFNKASERFEKITAGRYSLKMPENGEHSFMAYDNQNQEFFSLHTLSTATRIQLLISVRLAFIEMQEGRYRLPLLADELLANSDDVRAEAIIQALTEIAREGRQVFYFTAQQDEVAKWNTHLKKADIEYKHISIAPAGQSAAVKPADMKMPSVSLSRADVPEPGNDSHAAYAEKIHPPVFNPLTDNPSEIHLWYVIEDTKTLYNLLIKNISSLGALRSFLHAGGEVGAESGLREKLDEKYRILQRLVYIYRQGRSKPIDRQVLEASGAVSNSFIDEVYALLMSVNNDPQNLIRGLRSGSVKGFRSNKTDELETYLLENQYISQDEPLTSEAINAQLQAVISGMNLSPEDADRMINRIMNGDAREV